MKRHFYILIFFLINSTISNSQTSNLDGFSIDVEFQYPDRHTLDYHYKGVPGINISQKIASINDKIDFRLGLGYINYKPRSIGYYSISHPDYEKGDNLWSEHFSYDLSSIPLKLITEFNLETIKISTVFGIGIKKLKETRNHYENWIQTQIITEENYSSFISGIQIDVPIYKSFNGFFRLERHANSVLLYSEQGLYDGSFSSEYVGDSFEEIRITSSNKSSSFMVFGIKFNFSSK